MSTIETIGNVKIRAALVLMAIFIIGLAAGAALWHVLMAPPKMPPPMRGPLPFHKLGLSPDQHEKVDAILEAHRPELDAVLDDTYPRIRAINEKIEKEVIPVLTTEQQKRLEEIKARRPKGPRHMRGRGRHGPRMDHPGPRPGPPGPPPDVLNFPPPGRGGPLPHAHDPVHAPGAPGAPSPESPGVPPLERNEQ